MSEPSTAIAASLSASGYEDGLGRRSLDISRESGAMLERLHLRPELGAFEAFLRERVAFTASFDDERFARVLGIERDPRGALTIISQFVAGTRLSDLLEAATGLPADEATCPSVDAALGFLLELLPCLGSLHEHGGHAHGTLSPGRIVLTPASQVVVLDWLYGPTIQRLQFNRRRLWTEFGVASPPAGLTKLDVHGDVSQASLAAMMIVLGRPIRENEYPDAIGTLVSEVIEIAQIRGSSDFASGLQAFLERTLPLPSRKPHANTAEAVAEVRHVAREIGVSRCRTALAAFVDDMNRVLAAEREKEERDTRDPEHVEMHVGIDELTAAMIPDLASSREDFDLGDSAVATESALDSSTTPSFDEFEPSAGADVFEDSPAAETPSWEPTPEPVPPTPEPIPAPVFETQPVIAPIATDPPLPRRAVPAPAPEPEPERLQPVEPIAASAPVGTAVAVHREPVPPAVPIPVASPAALPPAPTAAAAAAPPPVPASEQATKASKRKKRGSKGHRDKLRSNATPPAPKPAPTPPAPPVAIPMPTFNQPPDPFRQNVPASTPVAVQPPAPPRPPAPIRLKSDAPSNPPRLQSNPAGNFNAPARVERRGSADLGAPHFELQEPQSTSNFPWRLAAAAVAGIIAVIGIGRAYIPGSKTQTETVEPAPAPAAATTEKIDGGKAGEVSISTTPAGAHVLLDGKAAGDSPLTLQGVTPGKHTLTFVTSTGTVKKPIRVEPGKPLSVDVPIYSGWIAVFSPVTLDIAENGKSIGTTEQGRLMLSPGRHQLTFSSRDMGYKTTQVVDIEPGEERSVSLVPTGELNANATPWAEVWMNGNKVGETPIAALRVPLGTHEVVFKNPKFPDRQVTVTVRATAPAMAFVDFTK
jgi:hypothetical protein